MAKTPEPAPGPPRAKLDFIQEIGLLAKATRILRESLGDAVEDSTYGDGGMPMVARCSPEIICMRTAMSLWCNVHNINSEMEKQGGPDTGSHLLHILGMRPAPPAQPPSPPLPTDEGPEEPEPDGE